MRILVPLSKIDDNPFQSRQEYSDIEELAGRIAAKLDDYPETGGLMQVPVGRIIFASGDLVKGDHYSFAAPTIESDPELRVQLAFGHRRKRAFDHLDAEVMPVDVQPLTDDQMLDAVWSENRERKDISAVEEAELLQKKLERAKANGGNQTTVAEAWGLARPTIANRLRLLDLPEEVQQANREGKLSERQCLALSTVARIGEMVNGQTVRWGRNMFDYWGDPASPESFIAHVVQEGDKVTSDKIRDYQRKLLDFLGQDIPDIVATTAVEGPAVVQPTCKGCKSRVNRHCLNADCLGLKKVKVGEHIARNAAAERNLEYSDNPKHFEVFADPDRARELKKLLRHGITENLVVGWHAYGSGARLDDSAYSTEERSFDGDGLAGVVLGHRRGGITGDELHQLAEVDEQIAAQNKLPKPEIIAGWDKQSKQHKSARKKRVKTAIMDALEPLTANPGVLRPLLALLDSDPLENAPADGFVKTLADYAWNRAYHISDSRENLEKLLRNAGLSPHLVDPPDRILRLQEIAIDALASWYNYGRRYATWSGGRKSIKEINQAREAFKAAGEITSYPELSELAAALEDAAEDIQRLTAKEEDDK